MTPANKDFLHKAFVAAQAAQHVFPEMAACEAALESGYGHSQLASQDNNLFGMKEHLHPLYETVSLPTREFLSNEWKTINSNWIVYPDWAACFADRMETLKRLAPNFVHYRLALAASSAEEYVRQVSMTWATDPNRSLKVLAIYDAVAGDWDATGS